MKTFYQIFSIQIDTVLSEYTTKHFAITRKMVPIMGRASS